MPQDHSTPFSWNNFYKKYRLSENSSQDDWRDILPRRHTNLSPGDWAKRFIALTRWFNVTAEDRNAVAAADRICTNLCSVGYAQFSNQQNRERLGEGLQEEGIILRNSNGQNQYLRTIMYYSGWMYVRFAKQISKNMNPFSWETIRKWEFPDGFKALLQADFKRFSAQEGDEGFQDIKDFFKDLAELYFERNENFTAEELLKRRPELLPNAAQKIVETLCSPNANDAKSETLPQIDVDCDGNAVFTLPEEGLFTGAPVRVEFHFFDHEERVFRYAVYNRNNGRYGLRWLNEEQEEIQEQNVPLEKIGSILRVCGNQKTDALPTVCISGAPHLLLKLEGGPGGYKRATGNIRRLQSRTTYKVVSFRGEEPKIRIIDGEKDELFPDVFTVPANAVSVRIDEIDYDVETSAATYLNLDNRTRAFSAENLPGRIFFETSSVPFTDNDCGLSARYSWKENGDAHEETFQVCGEETKIPETVFWREGFLELMADGRGLFKRAVTFIDDVALDDFRTKAAEIDREGDWNIRIGNEDIKVHIPREKNRAKFDFNGFSFSIPVKRCGVYFETGTSGELVHVPAERFGEGRVHDVAREDFRRFVLHVRAGSDTDEIKAIRGTAVGSLPPDKRKFIGEKLTSLVPDLKDSDSDHYAFQIGQGGNSKFYKFHVYDPETTRVSGKKYVEAQREVDDLVLTFWCAFSNREKQKCLVFFPAHRQDEPPVSFDAEPVGDEIDAETGRRKETIRIRDFYKKEIDWGHGLLCFVAHKVSVRGKEEFRPLSMGFFLKAPAAKRSDDFGEDDPYGLRRALAGDEKGHVDFNEIERIVLDPDDDVQNYLDGFFKNMKNNVLSSLTKGAFQSSSVAGRCLNAYWNRVSKEPSGYVFLCGRHYKAKENINDYHEYWDKLLISYQDKPLPCKSCLNNFNENALLKPWWQGPIPNARFLNNLSPRAKDALLTLVCKTLKLDFKTGTDQNANDEGGLIFYKDYWVFSYPQLSEAVRLAIQDGKIGDILRNIRDKEAKEIIETISRNWSNYRRRGDEESKQNIVSPPRWVLRFKEHLGENLAPYQAFSQAFNGFQDNPYMFYDGYNNSQPLQSCNRCIIFKNIQEFVKTIAGKLHEWRTNPTLEKAQNLRKIFFTLREIDRELFKIPELSFLGNEQKIGLCDAIECYANHLRRQEIGQTL